MERDSIPQTQADHGETSKETTTGTSLTTNAAELPSPPRLTPNPTLNPPTLTPISSSPPPPLTPAPLFIASLTPKTTAPPALIPSPPRLTPTPNLPFPTQTLPLVPSSSVGTSTLSTSTTPASIPAPPPSLTPCSSSPGTSQPPFSVTHSNINSSSSSSSSPKTSSFLTNGKTRPSPTPTSTPITPFHSPSSPTGKQLHSLATPSPVPTNQSSSPVSRVSQQALLLGRHLRGSGPDQVLLRAEMLHNLTLRAPGSLAIPPSLRLKPPPSSPPPLSRPRTPVFPPLRSRPQPMLTAPSESQTTPTRHLSVPPPTLYPSVRSVPLRPRLHPPNSQRAVPPQQSPALRPIAAAPAKHAPTKRLWTGLATCPSSQGQLRPSQPQHSSLSASHPLNSTSCFQRSPSAARQLQIIALSSGRQSQPSNRAGAHASVQSQPSVQESRKLVGESQRTLSAESINPRMPKPSMCKTSSPLPTPSSPILPPSRPQTSLLKPSQKKQEEDRIEVVKREGEERETERMREERKGNGEHTREERKKSEGEEGDQRKREKTSEGRGAEEGQIKEEKKDGSKERSGVGEMEGDEDQIKRCRTGGGEEREEEMEGLGDQIERSRTEGVEWMEVDQSQKQVRSQTSVPPQHCHISQDPEPDPNPVHVPHQNPKPDVTTQNQSLSDLPKKTQSTDRVNLCENLSAQSDNQSALSSLSSQSSPFSPPVIPPSPPSSPPVIPPSSPSSPPIHPSSDSPPPLLPSLSTHLSTPSLLQAESETISESQPGPWAQRVWPEGGRQVLTHLVEGFVIQEGLQPFPVHRSSLLVQKEEGVTQESQETNGTEAVLTDTWEPSAHSSDSDREGGATDDPLTLGSGHKEKKPVLHCQFCGKRGHAHSFMRSKRFCSTACARGYNVGLSKRLRVLSAGSRGEGRGSGLKRAMSVPGKPLLLRLPRDLWSAHSHDHKEEEEEDEEEEDDPAVSRLGRRAGRRRARRASEPAMTSNPTTTSHLQPSQWSVEQVCDFINTLQGCGKVADAFRLQEIDGQALLLLTEDHLMTSMNIKLGPALKICAHINALKHP